MALKTINDAHLTNLANMIRALTGGSSTQFTIEQLAPAILTIAEPVEWVGWSKATWADIQELCRGIKEGVVANWPNDVYVGKTKTLTFSEPFGAQSLTEMQVVIIGRDVDGKGTLTFQTVDTWDYGAYVSGSSECWDNYPNPMVQWNDLLSEPVNWDTPENYARYICKRFYDTCACKDYIKPLIKMTGYIDYNDATAQLEAAGDGTIEPAGLSEYVWIPSEFEVGLNLYSISGNASIPEATQGTTIPYPYFTNNSSRRKLGYGLDNFVLATLEWGTRSTARISDADDIYMSTVSSDGESTTQRVGYVQYLTFAPCFAIG